METSLNNFNKIIRKASSNKKLYVFLSCLCLTIFFWLLNALGNQYTTAIKLDIVYKNNPPNYIILNKLPNQLFAKVTGLGFDLLGYKLKIKDEPIVIDLSTIKSFKAAEQSLKSKIDFTIYESFISNQLGREIDVNEIFPKNVNVLLDEKSSKLVEISPLIDLNFTKQYQLDGEIKIKPAVINVTGPKSIIDTLTMVYTQDIVFDDLENTITHETQLNDLHKSQKLSFDLGKVIVFIPVEKFTESSLVIPIEYVNVPDSIELKAIPQDVNLKFMVPLSKLSNLTPSKFTAVVDYSSVNERYTKLKVLLKKYPDYLKGITIKPSKVEYILKRK